MAAATSIEIKRAAAQEDAANTLHEINERLARLEKKIDQLSLVAAPKGRAPQGASQE